MAAFLGGDVGAGDDGGGDGVGGCSAGDDGVDAVVW